jgi:hypothetical protein
MKFGTAFLFSESGLRRERAMGKKLTAARNELRHAQEDLERMRTTKNLDQADDAWRDLLGRLTRVWNKT